MGFSLGNAFMCFHSCCSMIGQGGRKVNFGVDVASSLVRDLRLERFEVESFGVKPCAVRKERF